MFGRRILVSVAFLVSLSGIFASGMFAQSAVEYVGGKNYEILKRDGNIQRNTFHASGAVLSLLPKTELSETIEELWSDTNSSPTLVGENLYLVKKSDLTSKPGSVTVDSASKVLRSVSRMEGMKYYSNGDKKWETLYKDAYCIKGPKDRTKVSDYVLGSADGQVQYCFLNDNSLGKTNYKISYFQNSNVVAADFVNTTGINIGPIKAVGEGNLHIDILVIDCEEELLCYMMVKAKFHSIGFLEDRMQKSFVNRLDAIYSWFIKQF